MNPRFKLVLMNCAVGIALVYRWLTGTPAIVLVIVAVIMFALVNGLLWLTQRKFNQPKRSR
jgi:Flp pilus assembly protein TadB